MTTRQQFWQRHLVQCKASGLTIKQYAQQHALKLSTLYFYRKKFALQADDGVVASSRFIRAKMSTSTTTLPCRVHLRNGVTVELGADQHNLPELFRTLSTLS